MASIHNFIKPVYERPSYTAFLQRKIFHTSHKDQSENVEEWFARIQATISGCEFGHLEDYMLIDKFMSELNGDTFDRIIGSSTLEVSDVLSIVTSDITCSFSIECKPELDLNEFFSLNEIKDEASIQESNNISDGIHSDSNASELDCPNESPEPPTLKKQTKLKGFKLNEQNRIICLDCDKIFSLKSSYNLHKRTHTGINLHQCEICKKTFTTRSKVKRHMKTHDHDGRTFECHLCGFEFDQFQGVKMHFNVKHLPPNKEILHCNQCDKTFTSKKTLHYHLKMHQGTSQSHKCPHCDKEFDQRYKLTVHSLVHSDFRQFVCETCGNAFKTSKQLKIHSQVHSGKKLYKCNECGQELRSNFIFKNHMRLHTGERPYPCDLCGKRFVQRTNLLKHLKVHRQEKSHECSMCSKRFATAYHLKVHMSVHTGAKPYKCQHCNGAFTQPGSLKLHVQKVHRSAK